MFLSTMTHMRFNRLWAVLLFKNIRNMNAVTEIKKDYNHIDSIRLTIHIKLLKNKIIYVILMTYAPRSTKNIRYHY